MTEQSEFSIPPELPILPLRGVVAYPMMWLPLMIGQERSIRLVDDAVIKSSDPRIIGLFASRNPEVEEPTPDQVYEIGTAAIVHRMLGTPDGLIHLMVQGIERVRVTGYLQYKPYLRAQVEVIPEEEATEASPEQEAVARTTQDLFRRLVSLVPHMPEELETAAINASSARQLAYLVGASTRMDPAQAQEILETDSVAEKLVKLNAILGKELEVLELDRKIQSQAQDEMSKMQRESFLREQLNDVSYAEWVTLSCPQCGHALACEAWLIVDTRTRSELVDELRTETLNLIKCETCGTSFCPDLPLLLFRPHDEPPITFSRAVHQSYDKAKGDIERLLRLLRSSTESEWRDIWLEQIGIVPIGVMPWFLDESLDQETRHNLAARSRQLYVAHFVDPTTYDQILNDLGSWVSQSVIIDASPDKPDSASEVVSEERPDLMTSACIPDYQELLAQTGTPQNGDTLDSNVHSFVLSETWHDSRYYLEENPGLLSDEAIEILNKMVEDAERTGQDALLRQHRDLLLGCIEFGVDAAFAYLILVPKGPADIDNEIARILELQQRSTNMPDLLMKVAEDWKQVLRRSDLQNSPVIQSIAKGNLALVYSDLFYFTRKEMWFQHSVDLFNDLLGFYNQLRHPHKWGIVQHGLGNLFAKAYEHLDDEALAVQALEHYSNALKVKSPDCDLEAWANTQQCRGNIHEALFARTGSMIHGLLAVTNLTRSLRGHDVNTAPQRWAEIQHSLGNVYSSRYSVTLDTADAFQAQKYYTQALKIRRRKTDIVNWGMTQLGLAHLFLHRYEYLANDYDALCACRRFNLVLAGMPSQLIDYRFRATAGLLRLHFLKRDWHKVTGVYECNYEALDTTFKALSARPSKESILREAAGLQTMAAYALAKLGFLAEAIEHLEKSRCRFLFERLQTRERNLEQLAALGHSELIDRYRLIARQLQTLQQHPLRWFSSQLGSSDYEGSSQSQLEKAESVYMEFEAILKSIREHPGYEDFNTLTFRNIQALIEPNELLVYLVTTPHGGLALIIPQSETSTAAANLTVNAVWLDNLTDAETKMRVSGYLVSHEHWHRDVLNETTRHNWFDVLDQVTRWLWDAVVGPLNEQLHVPSAGSIRIVPTGVLSLLPLHAAWTEDVTTLTGRRYAMDMVNPSYAPSAAALYSAKEMASKVVSGSILAVNQPTPVSSQPLSYSQHEVAVAIETFNQHQTLNGPQATRSATLSSLSAHSVAHLSCHGFASFDEPLAGGLVMAHDEILSLSDLLGQHLPGLRLAVLPACETGTPADLKLLDEVVSLSSGLLQAGAAGVVASLWSVDDISTTMLMTRFYELWRKQGYEPHQALRKAQQWVRDTTNAEKRDYFKSFLPEFGGTNKMPTLAADTLYKAVVLLESSARDFAHPYHWAAFTYTGV